MAGTVMHLVIADQLISKLPIHHPALFYCGNLAPDAIMNRENYEREMKRHTHFKDGIRLHDLHLPENFRAYEERFHAFYRDYVETDIGNHELYLGYVTHMLVDELYVLRFRDRYVQQLLEMGRPIDDRDFFKLYAKDVDLVDRELAHTYTFRHPMPEILLEETTYEIPGYITNRELTDSKNFIISKNFLAPYESVPFRIMNMEENLEFIQLCVESIPSILKERFNYPL